MATKNQSILKLEPKQVSIKTNKAAHYLVTKVPLARSTDDLSSIRSQILEKPDSFDTLNYVYVVSDNLALKGTITIRELLSTPPSSTASKVMTKKLVKIRPDTDAYYAAHLATRNSLKALPIVDKKDKLIGVLPADAIQKLLSRESQTKILQLAGIHNKNFLKSPSLELPLFDSYFSRIPWILAGLIGSTITATVITTFTDTLSEFLILASFIPLVAYLANAVATQTQSLLIRDLSLSADIPFFKYLAKQFTVSSMIGLTLWGAIILLTALIWNDARTGATVGLAVLAAVATASIFAVSIPTLLKKLNIDPANGSGPFATTIQDFLSILIYFSITSSLL